VNYLRRGAITHVKIEPIRDYSDPAACGFALDASAAKYAAYMIKAVELDKPMPSAALCACSEIALSGRRRFIRWGLLKPSTNKTAGDGAGVASGHEHGHGRETEDDFENDDLEREDHAPPQSLAWWRWSDITQRYRLIYRPSVDDYNERRVVSIIDEKAGGGGAG